MKTSNKKTSSLKVVIVLSAVTVISFLLTAIILAFPKMNAEKKLNSIQKLIVSSEIDNIVIYQHTPYETGTVDQVMRAFEKKLDDTEIKELTDRFLATSTSSEYVGVSEGYYAMTDYKIVVTHAKKRSVFYVSKDSVYVLEERMKTEFSCKSNPLYEYLDYIKESYFTEN